MSEIRERLRRRARPPASEDAPDGGVASLEELGVLPQGDSAVLARTAVLEGSHRHGAFALDEIDAADRTAFALLTGDGALAALDLRRAVYLDLETSGLSGGAGTWVFLVGLGSFGAGGAFEVWQGFLGGPEDERELLEESARRIRASAGIVSFFGKSFDRHRLEDRMRALGVEPPFEGLPHLDLYHPLRRLYRDALGDARLATFERELGGVERERDLPGSQAPAAWFDFLAGRRHRLGGVFAHNHGDVLSLVALAAHLGRARAGTRASGEPLAGPAATRARGLASAAWRSGARDEALTWIERAIALDPARDARLFRAGALLRLRRLDEARAAFAELAREPEDARTAPVLLELAKLAEHEERDPRSALGLCTRAGEVLARSLTGSERARLERDLARRTARLRAKLAAG